MGRSKALGASRVSPVLVGDHKSAKHSKYGAINEYPQFKLAKTVFNVGDSVMLRNPDVDGMPFTGKIMRIFELTTPKAGEESRFVDIQWYYRPLDTILPRSKHDPCELFESDSIDTNVLEAVDAHCTVLPWSQRASDDPAAFSDESLRDVFYCRRKYDPSRQVILEPGEKPKHTEPKKAKHTNDDDGDDEYHGNGESDQDDDTKKPVKRKRQSTLPLPKRRQALKLVVPESAPRAAAQGLTGVARSKLHVANVPESLPCREAEFIEICGFVEERIRDGSSGCMFVSGVPGTGKTATIRAVAKHLQTELASGKLPRFQFVEINGMALTTPQQAFSDLWHAVSDRQGTKMPAAQASALLEKFFTTPSPRRQCIVALVDELDQLWTRKQEVMYSLFDWPNKEHSRLIVVAVANTMDLPERLLVHRVASRLGLERVSFAPYTHEQLSKIIKNRLNDSAVFHDKAIELCARKVAAVSGDARRALDICRRAVELAGASNVVDMAKMSSALDEMTASPVILAIKTSTKHEKLFLQSIVALFLKTGIEETTFGEIADHHLEQCRYRAFNPPSPSALSSICNRLGSMKLLLVEAGDQDRHQRVRLNYPLDDVKFALTED